MWINILFCFFSFFCYNIKEYLAFFILKTFKNPKISGRMNKLSKKLFNWLWKAGIASFLLMFLLGLPSFVSASFAEVVNYQGKLIDDAGDLVVDGNYNMRFRLCADGSCTVVLYDELWTGINRVPVVNGLFSVLVGSVSSSLATVDFNHDVYLEVSVGGTGVVPAWETLTPRKRLGAVPNSFNSQ